MFCALSFTPIVSSINTTINENQKKIVNNDDPVKYMLVHIKGSIDFCEKASYETIIQKDAKRVVADIDEYNGIWKDMNFEGMIYRLDLRSIINPFFVDNMHDKDIDLKIKLFSGYMDITAEHDSYFLEGIGLGVSYT